MNQATAAAGAQKRWGRYGRVAATIDGRCAPFSFAVGYWAWREGREVWTEMGRGMSFGGALVEADYAEAKLSPKAKAERNLAAALLELERAELHQRIYVRTAIVVSPRTKGAARKRIAAALAALEAAKKAAKVNGKGASRKGAGE